MSANDSPNAPLPPTNLLLSVAYGAAPPFLRRSISILVEKNRSLIFTLYDVVSINPSLIDQGL